MEIAICGKIQALPTVCNIYLCYTSPLADHQRQLNLFSLGKVGIGSPLWYQVCQVHTISKVLHFLASLHVLDLQKNAKPSFIPKINYGQTN